RAPAPRPKAAPSPAVGTRPSPLRGTIPPLSISLGRSRVGPAPFARRPGALKRATGPAEPCPARTNRPVACSIVGKAHRNRQLTVCALSPHRLVLGEFQRVLGRSGLHIIPRQLESTLAPGLASPAFAPGTDLRSGRPRVPPGGRGRPRAGRRRRSPAG